MKKLSKREENRGQQAVISQRGVFKAKQPKRQNNRRKLYMGLNPKKKAGGLQIENPAQAKYSVKNREKVKKKKAKGQIIKWPRIHKNMNSSKKKIISNFSSRTFIKPFKQPVQCRIRSALTNQKFPIDFSKRKKYKTHFKNTSAFKPSANKTCFPEKPTKSKKMKNCKKLTTFSNWPKGYSHQQYVGKHIKPNRRKIVRQQSEEIMKKSSEHISGSYLFVDRPTYRVVNKNGIGQSHGFSNRNIRNFKEFQFDKMHGYNINYRQMRRGARFAK